MSVFVTNVSSMIGIGVAVDYSLFLLARYREEVRAGVEPEAARRTAMRTSGIAVLFSGVTVIVSLAGLFLVDSTTIRSMAMGAIVVVAVSILAAVTLLPALMRVLGTRAYTRGRTATVLGAGRPRRALAPAPARLHRPRRTSAPASGSAGPTRVMRRPLLFAARQRRADAGAGHPRAVAGDRRRRAAPVPRGQRDPRGRRAGRAPGRARARPDPTQVLVRAPATATTLAAVARRRPGAIPRRPRSAAPSSPATAAPP